MKAKMVIFSTLLLGMLFYIGWIFYMSEPTYTDNNYKIPEKYDYVSVPYFQWDSGSLEVETGIVIQIDSIGFVMKTSGTNSRTYQKKFNEPFKVIGKGTFYHKVNSFVGFNIMLITTFVIIILSIVVLITLIGLIREFLGWQY